MMGYNHFHISLTQLFVLFVGSIAVPVQPVEIVFDTSKIVHETDRRFLSVAIDSGVIRRHWERFDPSSKKVQALASALKSCYVRIGGTDADFLIFDPSSGDRNLNVSARNLPISAGHSNQKFGDSDHIKQIRTDQNITWKEEVLFNSLLSSSKNSDHYIGNSARKRRDIGYYGELGSGLEKIGYHADMKKDLTNFTMSAEMYDSIHQFVSAVGWEMIFDLNVLLRKDGHWDAANAIQLINYTVEKGYPMGGWELGNEPNAFHHLIGFRLEPETLAGDYGLLSKALRQVKPFINTTVLGPSVTQLNKRSTEKYFKSFLDAGGGDTVTAASFHQYYINGRTATIDQFMDASILNYLRTEVQLGVALVKASGSKARVWIGETSSAWGGGAPGLSDRYVAAFMWLDKLGIAARQGVDVVIRQSFYGGHYALIDSRTLDPNPDYWLSLLYKLLVGTRVLNVVNPGYRGKIRAYAHCTDTTRSGYRAGSVTVYVMNLEDVDIQVTLANQSADGKRSASSGDLHVYSMQPVDGDLKSQLVSLNGHTLRLVDDKIPNLLQPVITSGPVTIPAHTYSFIVMPDTNLQVCQ